MTPEQEGFLISRLKRLENQTKVLTDYLAETNQLLFKTIAYASNADATGLAAMARQVEANLTAIKTLK